MFHLHKSNYLLNMKKFFTILFYAPFLLLAQAPQRVDIKASKEANAQRFSETQSPVINKLKPVAMRKTNGDKPLYGSVTIGNTLYDLQSNNAVANRLQVYSLGRITAAWTTSSDGGASYAQRGTGYNQYISGAWRKPGPNNSRFENSRVGWPCVGAATFGGVEKEYVFAHAVASSGLTGGFIFSTNTGIGTDFTSGSLVLNDNYNTATTPGPIWGRSATAGSRIVIVSCFADSTSGYPVNYRKAGIKRPITYSVYDATTQSWVAKNALLPNYDSVRYDIGNADDYSIDASGNKVSIVIGGTYDDLALWKSTDAGTTWTKTIIDSFNRAKPTPRTAPKDINNGGVNVIIDANGVTHVAYAILGAAYDSVNATDTLNYVFYGNTMEGIAYWNDKINPSTGTYNPRIKVGYTPDQDGDNVITLATNTRNRTYGGYGSALQFVTGGATYCAISNHPMLSYDTKGNLFCTYIAPIEGDESADQENFNDIFVVYSTDSGKTWADAQNLTKTTNWEDFYPTLAKNSDNKLRLMYFLKDDPGVSVNNANNPETNVQVNFMEIPISKILHDSIGIFPNGISNTGMDAGFTVAQNVPNPFHGITQIDYQISQTNDIVFTVTDMLGKVLFTETTLKVSSGKHSLYYNASSLSHGIYFYSVTSGSQKITQKLIVE